MNKKQNELEPVDWLSYSSDFIKKIRAKDTERADKLWSALRMSIGSEERDSHRVDPSETNITTAVEISRESKFALSTLSECKILLKKPQAVEYLLFRGVSIDLKGFKNRSTKNIHEAKFGLNRLGQDNGFLFTYAEICGLVNESMSLKFDR